MASIRSWSEVPNFVDQKRKERWRSRSFLSLLSHPFPSPPIRCASLVHSQDPYIQLTTAPNRSQSLVMHFLRTLLLFLLASFVSAAAVPNTQLPRIDTTSPTISRRCDCSSCGSPIQLVGIQNGRLVLGPRFKREERVIKWMIKSSVIVISTSLVYRIAKEGYFRISEWRAQIENWMKEEESDKLGLQSVEVHGIGSEDILSKL